MKDARKLVRPRNGHFKAISAATWKSSSTAANVTLNRSNGRTVLRLTVTLCCLQFILCYYTCSAGTLYRMRPKMPTYLKCDYAVTVE